MTELPRGAAAPDLPEAPWPLGAGRKWLLLLGDAALVCVSLYAAYQIRFDGKVPSDYASQFWRFLPLLVAIRTAMHVAFGVHRWSFRLAGLSEGFRVVLAGLAGSALFVAVPYAVGIVFPPRSVVVVEFFLTVSLVGALRFSRRLTHPWLLEQRRSSDPRPVVRALIVGAGSSGELLLRDLQRSGDHLYNVVGFVDDDRKKWRMSIGGRPVLGAIEELPVIARKKQVEELLIAIPNLPPPRIREIVARCSDLGLKYRILPISFAYLDHHLGEIRLADLAPEDLLHRDAADFDLEGLRKRLEGRRVLVTGAGGSIGSEISRRLASLGVAELTLADIDENGLYLLYRQLQQRHPGLRVSAEVTDIRDRGRLSQLARERRPQDVFHAAAHKHVPLLEDAPHEAVKNNVFGCRNVIDMAEEAAAEHFVLISTDKAVRPSSVMGATKRLAEMLVRERGQRSSTAFTAVRFGNVLGSAGSVVPLFKQQIAAGGPVTVTHPDVRRYLMTVDEAVGLVIQAGLGGYAPLCILEMGEPIRILDLARYLITLCGYVPERDIPIVFTGLRPGEKLDEALLTEEEAALSRHVTRKIRAVDSPPPPGDLLDRLARLEAAASLGDREAVREALRAAVPDFEPAANVPATAAGA